MTHDSNECGRVFRRRGDLTKHHRGGWCPYRSNLAHRSSITQNQTSQNIDDRIGAIIDGPSSESDEDMIDQDNPEPFSSLRHESVVDASDAEDSDEICENESYPDPVHFTDLSAITITNNNQASLRDCSDSENEDMGELAVSHTQFLSATYILTTEASNVGLSISGTNEFLETQPKGGEVRLKWRNGRVFWKDHARRQRLVLSVGKWTKTEIEAPDMKIPNYFAWICDLAQTIVHIVSVARSVRLPNLDWSQELDLDASIKTNAIGQRIVYTFYSGDDLNYLIRALRLKEKHRQSIFVPVQLFIDKANVTRLNKRSIRSMVQI